MSAADTDKTENPLAPTSKNNVNKREKNYISIAIGKRRSIEYL